VVHCHALYPPSQYPTGPADWDWIPELAKEGGWIIITADPSISRDIHEQRAWLDSGLTAFFLAGKWGNLKTWEQTLWIFNAWEGIVETAKRHPSNAGFILNDRGKPQALNLQELRDKVRKKERKHGTLATRRESRDKRNPAE